MPKTFGLPKVLLDAIQDAAVLGKETQSIVESSLRRLWFDAAKRQSNGEVFLWTGDIPAMWIRDSTWQVRPLVRFAHDPEVRAFIRGVIASQVKFLDIDPYANAFNLNPNGNCWHKDFPDQSPWVFERKFELDSISGFLQLSLDLAEQTGDLTHLDASWWSTASDLVELLWRETRHEKSSYRFVRENAPAHDYLSNDGYGAPHANCGLIWSAFRPSDDACELPFHVPSNLHIQFQLLRLSQQALGLHNDMADSALKLANQVGRAIQEYALAETTAGKILAYEVDGLGGQILMDDANYPSLLSLPFLGAPADETYLNTRKFVLSESNPWYFSGEHAAGIGSPHTGANMVWPLAIGMKGLSSADPGEHLACLRLIEQTRSSSGYIHESFNVSDPETFTRDWFSWAEMTYVDLAFRVLEGTKAQRKI